jgi:ABC-type branched-subunit amino acid transport system ATPase component
MSSSDNLSAPVIEARAISAGYVGQAAITDVSLTVSPGEVVCLLGPNGAGKTSTLLSLAGELPLMSGQVLLHGEATTEKLHRRARNGLSYITEERSVFKAMTTRENFRCGGVDPDAAVELFPELQSRMDTRAGLLSGGEQQMLTLARALNRGATILLADELSLGLAPLIVERLLQAVREAADRGMAALIVEQHARKALRYADRVVVMRRGRVEMTLPAAEAISRLSEIEDAYLTTTAPA